RFRVIGDGGTRPKLQEELAKCDANNVELLPPTDREGVKAAYRDSDYLLIHLNDLPAFEKVLPSKLFEYAATKKPVLAGVSGYPAKFLKEHVDGVMVFPPGEVDNMISQLESSTWCSHERKGFTSHFSRENIMQEMVGQIQRKYLK
ncbi:MAG: glycosyltransferase, partial [Bacteroidota bacterium]